MGTNSQATELSELDRLAVAPHLRLRIGDDQYAKEYECSSIGFSKVLQEIRLRITDHRWQDHQSVEVVRVKPNGSMVSVLRFCSEGLDTDG